MWAAFAIGLVAGVCCALMAGAYRAGLWSYRVGATLDPTKPGELVIPTARQLAARFRAMTDAELLVACRRVLANAADATICWQQGHDWLREDNHRLQERLAEALAAAEEAEGLALRMAPVGGRTSTSASGAAAAVEGLAQSGRSVGAG